MIDLKVALAYDAAINGVNSISFRPIIHAHWMLRSREDKDPKPQVNFFCSNCAGASLTYDGNVKEAGNFCKWCGAIMDESPEHERY